MTTQAAAEKPKPPRFIPKLNREGVGDWTGGSRTKSFGFTDFGSFVLALKRMSYDVGDKNNQFWRADCKVISCQGTASPGMPTKLSKKIKDPERFFREMTSEKFAAAVETARKAAVEGKYKACWTDPTTKFAAGTEASIFFPVNRPGTANQPKLDESDDRFLTMFLRAVLKVPKGQVRDFPRALETLDDFGAIENDNMTFGYESTPNTYAFELCDGNEVLRSTVKVGVYRDFFATPGDEISLA